jgi:dual specificity protein kinase YAK1
MLSALLASQNNETYNQATSKSDIVPTEAISPSNNDDSPAPAAERASPSSIKDSENSKYDRTTKVAKTKYSDHGSHAVIVDETSESPSQVPNSDEDEISVEKKCGQGYLSNEPPPSLIPLKRTSPSVRSNKPTSLLHAVLTKGTVSDEVGGDAKSAGPLHEEVSQRDECLTNPSDPVSNGGCDNIEGNLIVHKNDLLKIPHRKISNHSQEVNSLFQTNDPLGIATFQVIRLLGQGTFAQVFECKNVDTGKLCAIKIVKNKPAYTRQAAVEIEVFKTMTQKNLNNDNFRIRAEDVSEDSQDMKDIMVSLLCYFMYKSHLCLVFELLGQNLYELLKRRQFRGLPIGTVKNIVRQALVGMRELGQRRIVHCDLKPENILLVSEEMMNRLVDSKPIMDDTKSIIKLIDFGSACFEEKTGFTYIQSRFYRSPEVLVGINYDSAIDMWSLGCVAAELFLGLPILPGAHELDQLGRIQEMIGDVPEWMLDQG